MIAEGLTERIPRDKILWLLMPFQNFHLYWILTSDGLCRRTCNTRHAEDSPETGPNRIGIIDIRLGIANNDGIQVGGICSTKNGAKIPGLSTDSRTNIKGFIDSLLL